MRIKADSLLADRVEELGAKANEGEVSAEERD